ncbi:hypothetical protein [Candidatus Poriferisodalis sp.]|uniref:hypothetical protein n=1 Tax=Candidatus Poriferisodalis sp. TaxID=3101277 RepID=UPI003AF836D3
MSDTEERERRARSGWAQAAQAAQMAQRRGATAAGSWPPSRFDTHEWEWQPPGENQRRPLGGTAATD